MTPFAMGRPIAALDVRMPRQQLAVAVIEADRAVRPERDGGEELLDALQLDGGRHHADEFAFGPDTLRAIWTTQVPVARLLYRFAHEGGQPRVGLEGYEEVPIGDVDRRDRP